MIERECAACGLAVEVYEDRDDRLRVRFRCVRPLESCEIIKGLAQLGVRFDADGVQVRH